MPTKESIAANKITERMLVPHLRWRQAGGRAVFASVKGVEDVIQGICGETIEQGDAVFLGDDNKIYKADALSQKPAFGFALIGGIVDQEISIRVRGKINIELDPNIPIGSIIFLRSQGQVGQIERLNSGDLIQYVGLKLDSNELYIIIENFYEIE
jgi:hypothetical protein